MTTQLLQDVYRYLTMDIHVINSKAMKVYISNCASSIATKDRHSFTMQQTLQIALRAGVSQFGKLKLNTIRDGIKMNSHKTHYRKSSMSCYHSITQLMSPPPPDPHPSIHGLYRNVI